MSTIQTEPSVVKPLSGWVDLVLAEWPTISEATQEFLVLRDWPVTLKSAHAIAKTMESLVSCEIDSGMPNYRTFEAHELRVSSKTFQALRLSDSKVLYLDMAFRASDRMEDGTFGLDWRSAAVLCEDVGIQRKHLSRVIDELVDSGLLIRGMKHHGAPAHFICLPTDGSTKASRKAAAKAAANKADQDAATAIAERDAARAAKKAKSISPTKED